MGEQRCVYIHSFTSVHSEHIFKYLWYPQYCRQHQRPEKFKNKNAKPLFTRKLHSMGGMINKWWAMVANTLSLRTGQQREMRKRGESLPVSKGRPWDPSQRRWHFSSVPKAEKGVSTEAWPQSRPPGSPRWKPIRLWCLISSSLSPPPFRGQKMEPGQPWHWPRAPALPVSLPCAICDLFSYKLMTPLFLESNCNSPHTLHHPSSTMTMGPRRRSHVPLHYGVWSVQKPWATHMPQLPNSIAKPSLL